jgi:DMSO reductase family type II enzyme heme b subunit
MIRLTALVFLSALLSLPVYAIDENEATDRTSQHEVIVLAEADADDKEGADGDEDEDGDEEDDEVEVDCTCVDGELECADEDAEEAAEENECECDEDEEVACEDGDEEVEVDCKCVDEELECADEEEEEKAEEYECECDEDGEVVCEGGGEENTLGKELFEAYCARCHGFEGDGKGEASNFTYPRPRDFTAGMFKFRSTPSGEPPTDDDLKRTILGGLAGTSMFGWKNKLGESDVEAIIEYIKTEFAEEVFEFEGEPFEIGEPPPASEEIIKLGTEIFQKAKCWECHGKFARGNGEKGWQPNFKDDWGDKIWPTNLNHPWEMRNGASLQDIFRSITTALDGTPMPSFADAYSDEQRWGVAHYIKSLHITRKLGSRVTLTEVEKIPDSAKDTLWERVEHLDMKVEGKKVFGMTLLSAITNIRIRGIYTKTDVAIMLEWMDKKPDKGDDDFPPDSIRLLFPVRRGLLNIWSWMASDNRVTEYSATGQSTSMKKQKINDIKGVSDYSEGIYRVVFKRPLDTGDKNDINFNVSNVMPFSVIAYDGKNMEEGERGARSGVKYMVCKDSVPAEKKTAALTKKGKKRK